MKSINCVAPGVCQSERVQTSLKHVLAEIPRNRYTGSIGFHVLGPETCTGFDENKHEPACRGTI